ncbi:bifunctional hydroxymethylpyrimidine kinase/phosphomethylpyrimidine kinase [Propionivibrio limicola]|uniref:bifunctional hydroxymethylpyrimidine kinase/phosphomethylpyrimidine kinase n=1 Tax=Propionivibrio limicola TaxID=167645 RepID=UPI0012914DA9|nr:bifunctional hydroxymethylpyrimidine kinase/phosphomethylpyrimidine kinase [Propionivibrio limicola]
MNILPSATCRPAVLAFAASDPTGGAGIQADIMTLSALGCHALSTITALTTQDTIGVSGVRPVPPDWVENQARTVLADIPVSAFKIGLIGSADNVAAIARILADYPAVPVVLDPVLASGRGDALANVELIAALREQLLPLTTILTPNSLEARRLAASAESTSTSKATLAACADRLTGLGARYILLTGTHEETADVVNTLYDQSGPVHQNRCQRLAGSYHGSGCTIASAIAAGLAHGKNVIEAVAAAEDYTWQTLANAFHPGRGQYIPDRFFRQRLR